MDLHINLPRLIPRAITWAEEMAADVASRGKSLGQSDLLIAKAVGVQQADRIRVLLVDQIPLPSDPELKAAAIQAKLLGPDVEGLTLGYSILICHGRLCRRLLSHECRHVFQYEKAGSIALFLPLYLESVVQVGYWDSTYERDARKHEQV